MASLESSIKGIKHLKESFTNLNDLYDLALEESDAALLQGKNLKKLSIFIKLQLTCFDTSLPHQHTHLHCHFIRPRIQPNSNFIRPSIVKIINEG